MVLLMDFRGGAEENYENSLGTTTVEEQMVVTTLFRKLCRLYEWRDWEGVQEERSWPVVKSGPNVSTQNHYVTIDLMTRVNDLYLLSLP